ncbi:hypothetical protein QTH90_30190 [Variovorax sp. J2P1-59]|uniref:hypothetical protein n=1 Tax=Variovorax flavidus TaxID=3053501 RepID=UPI002577DFDE|nr:hypothetical protein [Variovorax sp. J2P1-59]MDM0078712.1 hypothetical protein [Variovorax sp. J2P1-59]
MKSITYWNRLEPRQRAREVQRSLQARIRDPLWLLARQWQFGEFRGEDAASPAWVQIAWRHSPFTHWAPRGEAPRALAAGQPLEPAVQSEAFDEQKALEADLGQLFDELLEEQGAPATARAKVLGAYPVPVPTEAELAADPDTAEARLWRVLGGRCIDGMALLRAAVLTAPDLPPPLTAGLLALTASERAAVLAALAGLQAHVARVHGAIGEQDAPSWRAERLEYDADAIARGPDNRVLTFDAEAAADGSLDWYAFDVTRARAARADDGDAAIASGSSSVLPMHVRFRGMPNHRWWAFENNRTDFGAIEPDLRDVGRLLATDFMTVAANDWFVAPLVLPVGTLSQIDLLLVHDVFGGRTRVPRANDMAEAGTRRWAMFAHRDGDALAPYFALPPSALSSVVQGEVLEDVRFLRDEMANMVWAVEHRVPGGAGEALAGHERAVLDGEVDAAEPTRGGPLLHYQLETLVPAHWIPLLPVAIDPLRGEIALERGAVARARSDGTVFTLPPLSRILRPTGVQPYRVREEEVTRAGTQVTRVAMRTRWWDGSTHVWISRRKAAGSGEGSSGLRYDLAIPTAKT